MRQLIKLEMQKHKLQAYTFASIIITITMIALIYLFAYAPRFDPNDADLLIFQGYDNIILFYSVVQMTVFCVFSCVIYARFIIDAYQGKRLLLLFSYPISRKKIFFSKIMIVSLFIGLSMIICNTFVFTTFFLTESIYPIVEDSFSFILIIDALQTTFIMIIAAASLSVIATGIGFFMKSVPAALIAGVILSSMFCNITFYFSANDMFLSIFMMIALLGATIMIILLTKKINALEVL